MREHVCRVTIKDCDVQTFRVSGAGGQHRDKTSAGVRIKHRASGAVGRSTESRSQRKNKQVAFRRMAESEPFQRWANIQAGIASVATEDWLREQLRPENLIIENCDDVH
jgi:protein subunit release factor B